MFDKLPPCFESQAGRAVDVRQRALPPAIGGNHSLISMPQTFMVSQQCHDFYNHHNPPNHCGHHDYHDHENNQYDHHAPDVYGS